MKPDAYDFAKAPVEASLRAMAEPLFRGESGKSNGRFICAIDPGLSGGLVVLSGERNVIYALPMPVVEIKQKGKKSPKRDYDLVRIKAMLRSDIGTPLYHVFLEKQQAMSQPVPFRCGRCDAVMGKTTAQGAVSIFSHARGYGLLEGLIVGLGLPYTLVHPRSWQGALLQGLGGDSKARARQVAERLFPGLDLRSSTRAKKPHEGIVDALLLAEYGWRRLGGELEPEDKELGF